MAEIQTDENGIPTFTYSWHRIRSEYREYTEGTKKPKGATMRHTLPQWEQGGTFYGSTDAEMRGYLSNGFTFESRDKVPAPKVAAPLPDWQYNDNSGEFDRDMFNNGDTDYYLDVQQQTVPMGVSLIVGMGFNSSTRAEMINDYSAWIGSVIESLESGGFSLQISLEFEGEGRYRNITGSVNHRIVVSEFGKTNLETDWSALFAPGAYRHLGWMAYMLPTEDGQATLMDDLGRSTTRGFGVKWDKENRTIRTTVRADSARFDSELMNREYAEALKQASS